MIKTVDEYIDGFDENVQQRLFAIRDLVASVAPEAVESYTYGLMGYKFKGRPLVYAGGFARHIGFYATPNGHDAFKLDFLPYKQGKGSVQFPLNQPLPLDLIGRVIEYRKDQINGTL